MRLILRSGSCEEDEGEELDEGDDTEKEEPDEARYQK